MDDFPCTANQLVNLKIIGGIASFQDILMKIQPLSPRALIVDSIQTVYLKEVTGSAGGLSQVGIFLHHNLYGFLLSLPFGITYGLT